MSYVGYNGQASIIALTALARLESAQPFSESLFRLAHWLRNLFIADLPFGAVNFNDSLLHPTPPVMLLTHLASRSGDPVIQGYALEALATCEQIDHLILLGLREEWQPAPLDLPLASCYQRSGTVIWRTSSERDGVFFAMQSGLFAGAHQHRDRNTFFLTAYGDYLLVDAGDGRYLPPPGSRDFFETTGHNCVLIDGRGQIGSAEAAGGREIARA